MVKNKEIIFHITSENQNLIIQINYSDENKGDLHEITWKSLFLCFILGWNVICTYFHEIHQNWDKTWLKARKTWALISLCLASVGPAYDVTFTEVRDDSVVVEWKAPVYNGTSAITGYFVEKSKKGSDNWSKVNESSVNHCYLKVSICAVKLTFSDILYYYFS